MLKDRGMKKWQGFFLPEHISLVIKEFENQNKITHQTLDEDKLNDIDILIHEAMEYAWILKYSLYKDGYIKNITGRTAYIDYLKNQLRIQDENGKIHYVDFSSLVDVERA